MAWWIGFWGILPGECKQIHLAENGNHALTVIDVCLRLLLGGWMRSVQMYERFGKLRYHISTTADF